MNWFYGRPSAPTNAATEPLRFDPPTFDYLGPATPETRAEVKAGRQNLNAALVVATFIVTALVMLAVGIFIGAVKPQIWNHVPFVAGDCDAIVQPCRVVTPVPSGERAKPEESAR